MVPSDFVASDVETMLWLAKGEITIFHCKSKKISIHLHIMYHLAFDYLMTETKVRQINLMNCRIEQHLAAMVMGLTCLLVYLGVDF